MKTSPNDASNQEILVELKNLSAKVDANHAEMVGNQAEAMGAIHELANHMDEEFVKVRAEMATKEDLNREIGKVRAVMVTKGYLDDKLADLKSDMLQTTRREIQRAMR